MPLGVHFTDTVTLGAALIAASLGLLALYRAALGSRLKTTNEILGKELVAKDAEIERLDREASQQAVRLTQLGAEKDGALAAAAACQATVDALSKQLEQMPRYDDVIRLFGEQMNHADAVSNERTQHAVKELAAFMERNANLIEHNELKAQQRHEASLKVLQAIERKLSKEPA